MARGGVHALIGPNGSGKTTTLNVLSGLYGPTARHASCSTAGTSPRLPPHARAAAGLGRTFQNIRLFRSMTRARERRDRRRAARQPARRAAAARRWTRAPARRSPSSAWRAAPHEPVSGFSYGHQRLIEIARALAGNPTLLLLDEPAAGLNSSEKIALTRSCAAWPPRA